MEYFEVDYDTLGAALMNAESKDVSGDFARSKPYQTFPPMKSIRYRSSTAVLDDGR